VFVEFLVLVVADFRTQTRPDRFHGIERLVVFLAVFLVTDRVGHEIRIPFDDASNREPIVEVLDLIVFFEFFQMQHDGGAAHELAGVHDGIGSVAGRLPLRRVVLAGAARQERDNGIVDARVDKESAVAGNCVLWQKVRHSN